MTNRITHLIIIFCISVSCAFSQSTLQKNLTFQWDANPIAIDQQLCPFFTEAVYETNYGVIPLYKDVFTVDKEHQTAIITLSEAVFLPIAHENLLTDFEYQLITDSLQFFQETFLEKNRSGVVVKIMPYRKNSETGLLEQLYFVNLNIQFSNDLQQTSQSSKADSYPDHSIFASGDWYKLEVATSGVYKIRGSDLKNAGMDIASINPKNLKLYGNGGSMIPEANSQQKYLSLQENAILVIGEEDNVFNESDYILFYGESPNVWQFDETSKSFKHQMNVYSNYNYYFIGSSEGSGKRIQTTDNNELTASYNSNQSDYFTFHELEETNLSNGGKIWLGENFNSVIKEQNFSINIPNLIVNEPISITTGVCAEIAAQNAPSYFKFSVNGTTLQNIALTGSSNYSNFKASYKSVTFPYTTTASSFTLNINFNGANNVNGWLDYFEICARRSLIFTSGQMQFCDSKSVQSEQITQFTINNVSQNISIWNITDLTDIHKMAVNTNGSSGSFKIATDSINYFIAFDGTSFHTPSILGRIVNQDLTGMRNIQSVIVSPPDFLDLAETLAQAHRNDYGLNTVIVTPQQIYNEFSSGKQDVGAIRDFIRMLYKTAQSGQDPQYLLLYGKGSYDYKNILGKNTNIVPIWTSAKAYYSGGIGEAREYSTDDFYGFLDDTEGDFDKSYGYIKGFMDIGIGRFPVKNRHEAEVALDKRLHYTSNEIETKGAWQNIICFTTDDGDGKENFPSYSERLATIFETLRPSTLVDKIYIDAYKQIHAAGGTRYPDAKNALTHRINTGSLIVDYVGHGSIYGWAEERIMEVSDAQNYSNYDHLTFLVTATCSFTRYDDPEKVSAGEFNFLNAKGSAIGLLTTIRETSSGGNQNMVSNFYTHLISDGEENAEINSIGHAYKKAKFKNSNNLNAQYFILLGDPTMPLAFPKDFVQNEEIYKTRLQLDKTTSLSEKSADINQQYPDQSIFSTIEALSEVTISGEIQDQNGNRIEDFNGLIYSKIFDKQAHLRTLQNDPNSPLVEFDLWKNIIFSSNNPVKNGRFSFSFFVPKDIDYTYGNGRISYYAVDTVTFKDAAGTFGDFLVGGINPEADVDTLSPYMNLYINNRHFVSGGITNENPILVVDLYDLHGINTTGYSVGHDLIAILDDDQNALINLNNFYNTKEDYTNGSAVYQFYNLSEGEHTVTVKAWDSYNNSVSKTINFTVVHSENIIVENLYNYPNPMKQSTNFVFEHNQAGQPLDITLQIFDLTGRLVYQIQQNIVSNGYRTDPISWDGTCNGAILNNGIYIYRARIIFPDGTLQQKSNKLIIAR